jgi:integrase
MRAKNEGTIYQDKHGVWWAQLPAGPDGRRPRRKAASQEEALLLLRKMHAERDAGRDLSRRAETVRDLLDDWLETIKPQIRPNTYRHYRDGIRHISDAIGAMRIDAVTWEHVQRLANKLTADGIGPATVRSTLSRLHAAYERVVPERAARNPVDWKKLRLRKAEPAERRPLDAAQLHAVLVAADDLEARGAAYRIAPAYWLAGLLGFRRGEVLGAPWRDLDWQRGTLTIRQQRVESPEGETFGPPKTPAARRTVPLGPRTLARLRLQWEQQQAERKHRGAAWKEHGLILAQDDGTPYPLGRFDDELKRLCRALGLPPAHPHLLRHGAATLLDEAGFSETVIAAVLGHTTKGTTRRYTHAREAAVRRAVAAVEALVFELATEAGKEAV